MKNIFTLKKTIQILIFILIINLLNKENVQAQDPQFSQASYATPLFLNPAFAGSTSEWRGSAIYRTQWSGVATSFNTAMFSVDHNLQHHHNGIGLTFVNDKAGEYVSNSISGYYAHHISFGSMGVSFGLQGSFFSKSLNLSNYVFRDQLRLDANQMNPTQEVFGNMTFSFPSFGGGVLVKNEKFWFGIAANHLNTPAKSLVGDVSLSPMKITAHGGFNLLALNKHGEASQISTYPGFVFKKQGAFTQLDLGVNVSRSSMNNGVGYVAGIWYRGMFTQSSVGGGNRKQDALVLLGGLSLGNFTINYSYDMTISGMSNYANNSHEISIIFENNLGKDDMRKGGIANPIYMEKFMKKKGKRTADAAVIVE